MPNWLTNYENKRWKSVAKCLHSQKYELNNMFGHQFYLARFSSLYFSHSLMPKEGLSPVKNEFVTGKSAVFRWLPQVPLQGLRNHPHFYNLQKIEHYLTWTMILQQKLKFTAIFKIYWMQIKLWSFFSRKLSIFRCEV